MNFSAKKKRENFEIISRLKNKDLLESQHHKWKMIMNFLWKVIKKIIMS